MTSLEFTSEDDLIMLWNKLESGKIHLSHEVCDHICHAHAPSYHDHQPKF